MFRLLLLACMWIAAAPAVHSNVASSGTVRGIVTSQDGSRLPGVAVALGGGGVSTVTNDLGEFALERIPSGMARLLFDCPGFVKETRLVEVRGDVDTFVEVRLALSPLAFEVTVAPPTPKLMTASESIGVVTIDPEEVVTVLPSMGEKDLFRAFQWMPGVSAANESSSGLYVRGGTPDQNLVLFDGFTVYDVDHFFGILSAFNTNAIESVTMQKGAYEARYGERLSSVVDVVGRSPRTSEALLGAGFSLLSTNAYGLFPLGSKATLTLAGRKSYQSPISNRMRDTYTDSEGGDVRAFGGFSSQPDTSFFDLNLRFTYDPTPQDRIIVAGYDGKDRLDNSRSFTLTLPEEADADTTGPIDGEIVNEIRWGNLGTGLTWFRQWNDRLQTALRLGYSRYFKDYQRTSTFSADDSESDDDSDDADAVGAVEHNRLEDFTLRLDNFLNLGFRHQLEFGGQYTENRARYSIDVDGGTTVFAQNGTGRIGALFVQDSWNPFHRVTLRPGLRVTYYDLTGEVYPEPRFSLILRATDRVRFKAAAGSYHQFASRLTRSSPREGDQDFWMLSDGDLIPVGSATHAIAGASYQGHSYLFDVELYRKKLDGLSEFDFLRAPPGSEPEDIDLASRFYQGSGTARGVEFLIQKTEGAHNGWLTYSLGTVDYLFPQISTESFPASHDVRHELKLVDSYRWRDWIFSGAWLFATGRPYTLPIDVETITMPNEREIQLIELGDKNSARLPDYHRLDLAATWTFLRSDTRRASAGVSVFNVYNHRNVWKNEYDVYGDQIFESQVDYLGLTLSAFLNIDFLVPSEARKAGTVAGGSPQGLKPNDERDREEPEEVHDFYGWVQSMDSRELVVDTQWGLRTLEFDRTSIKGKDQFASGTKVHVFYKEVEGRQIVTIVVRKVER